MAPDARYFKRCALTLICPGAGYIPRGMSREEAQDRGFIGGAGGGLLGMWLGMHHLRTSGVLLEALDP